jgi:hypothetical protein
MSVGCGIISHPTFLYLSNNFRKKKNIMTEKYYPDILAVDPEDCGCTECIVKEYIPVNTYVMNAKVADVVAFIQGDVSNHTYFKDTVHFFEDYGDAFEDESAKKLIKEFLDEVNRRAKTYDVKSLVDTYLS